MARNRSTRTGLSLVELLVSISILAILLGLTLPLLSVIRLHATELRCQSRIREVGRQVVAYTGDHRDFFPNWLGDSPSVRNDPRSWPRYTSQIHTGLRADPWKEYVGVSGPDPILRCPANQHDASVDVTDFKLSASMFAEPSYFDPDLPQSQWMARLGAKAQTVASVRTPSSKVGVFEFDVWHGWRESLGPGANMGTLEYHGAVRAGSVWFFDGHAALLRARDALPYVRRYPTWPVHPFGTTAWGVLGRDK